MDAQNRTHGHEQGAADRQASHNGSTAGSREPRRFSKITPSVSKQRLSYGKTRCIKTDRFGPIRHNALYQRHRFTGSIDYVHSLIQLRPKPMRVMFLGPSQSRVGIKNKTKNTKKENLAKEKRHTRNVFRTSLPSFSAGHTFKASSRSERRRPV